MFTPFILVGFIGYRWYKNNKEVESQAWCLYLYRAASPANAIFCTKAYQLKWPLAAAIILVFLPHFLTKKSIMPKLWNSLKTWYKCGSKSINFPHYLR
jgi:hypothetical protein